MAKKDQKIQRKQLKTMSSSPSSVLSLQQLPTLLINKEKYKGVRMRSWGSWVSEIRAPNQKSRIWLGSYSTPEAAARAYDAALLCVKGPIANLNFSSNEYEHDSFTTSTNAPIMSPKSIKRVAAAAAATAIVPSPPQSPSVSSPFSPSQSSSSNENSQSFSLENNPLDGTLMAMVAPWCNLDSPRYNDMIGESPFKPLDEECDEIHLWSFY